MRIESLVRLQFAHRRFILATLSALMVLAGWGVSRLGFDFSPQNIFVSGDQEYRRLQDLQRVFGRDDNLLLIHLRSEDLFSAEFSDYLFRLHDALAAVDGVATVDDLTTALIVRRGTLVPVLLMPRSASDYSAIRRQALSQPLAAGRVVSTDGLATLVTVAVADDRMDFADLAPIVEAVLAITEELPRPGDVAVSIVGIPLARFLLVDRLQADQIRFLPLCALLFFVVLWIVFREIRAVLVPLVAVLVSLFLTAGLLGAMGEKINIINNVLPTLLLVIGVSDAIHLVARYRQELSIGSSQASALHTTVSRLSVACFLTSITTAIGFASLALGRLDILRRFGLYSAAGVLIAYGITVVLVPVVLSYLAPVFGDRPQAANKVAERSAAWTARFVMRRRYWILAASGAVIAGSLLMATRVRVENRLFESFPASDPVVEANRLLERDFAGVIPFAIVVQWDVGIDVLSPSVLSYLDELGDYLRGRTELGGVLSVVDVIEELNFAAGSGAPGSRRLPESAAESRRLLNILTLSPASPASSRGADLLGRLFSADERMLRISASSGDVGSRSLAVVSGAIQDRLALDRERQRELGLTCFLSGDGFVGSAAVDRLIGDMFRSLLVAFGLIFLIMIVVLGSLRAAIVSMVANVFPLLLTLGVMGAIGLDLQVPTIIVFSVALGLAVDDTIHFMVRFKEEWRGAASGDAEARYERAILRTFRGTGQAIFVTSIVLAAGYSVLLASSFPITQKFGLGMLMTVTGALIGDVLVLPACLVIFKPYRVQSEEEGSGPDRDRAGGSSAT